MPDVYTKDKRSEVMRKVRSTGNRSTELKLIEFFRKNNITGWRRKYQVKGHPDFVFMTEKVAIFVDGCFWHGHDCRNTRPEVNKEYWVAKRERNIRHDKEVTELFEKRNWRVLRIWECELKKKNEQVLRARFQEFGL